MTSREKINAIFDRKNTAGTGYWTGHPHVDTMKIYQQKLNITDSDDLFRILKDDCRFIHAEGCYFHPENKLEFDVTLGVPKTYHGQAGCFAEAETIAEIENYPWPDVQYLQFTNIINYIKQFPDKAIFTGLWSAFFHIVSDFFGMENYFVKMYTDPEVVEAVTEHVVSYYEQANDLFFTQLGDAADIFFFGNDLGSQIDLLMSPELFQKFVLPGIKRLTAVAKKHNKKVLLHSCGSIDRVIPMLIDAGVDALHPLQARAKGMDAATLSKLYKNDLTFVGGVDTQDLLVHATPQQIKEEVYRLKELFGPNFVVSPSHEALLPNVPLENVIAMSEAAHEL